jgi:hypothetical protein
MNDLRQQLKQHIESAPLSFEMHQAPGLSEAIWKRYQQRKKRQWMAIAAGVCMLSMTFLMQQGALSEPVFMVQNHQLERELASLSDIQLSEQQLLTMANWQHELALIDEDIEQQGSTVVDQNVWNQRSNILSQMVAFYHQPVEVFEL